MCNVSGICLEGIVCIMLVLYMPDHLCTQPLHLTREDTLASQLDDSDMLCI